MRLWPLVLGGAALAVGMAFVLAPPHVKPPRPGEGANVLDARPAYAGPMGKVNVAVFDDGAPLAGRHIVFQDGAGAVVAEATSGDDGKASADAPAGGMVTVAYGNSVYQLITVTGVQPGDDIVIGETEDEGGAARVVSTARVKLPGAYPKAARYTVSLGVGATEVPRVADPLPLPVAKRFLVDEKKFRVLGEALDEKGAPAAYAFDWANLSTNAARRDVDVRLPAWSRTFREFTLALSAPTEGLTAVEGQVSVLANERDRFERPRQSASMAGPTPLRFLIPKALEGDTVYRLEFSYGASPDKAMLARSDKALSDTTRIDLREALLPRISLATVEAGADVARPTVRYRVAGDASQADAAIVRLAWHDAREHLWTILAPPATPEIQLPQLPASLKDWIPGRTPLSAAAALVEASFYKGYDDIRHEGLTEFIEDPESGEPRTWRYSATGDISF
ncbi:hypothetical protein LVJ94_25695 [Pendulispora rubella]|uniref:Carboxypeptidase regulatory-like domain-containing protein n=1 Tax=Pendulispora rubella TaxID=2741070 RepID=A0ABZ2LI36_9BACT